MNNELTQLRNDLEELQSKMIEHTENLKELFFKTDINSVRQYKTYLQDLQNLKNEYNTIYVKVRNFQTNFDSL